MSMTSIKYDRVFLILSYSTTHYLEKASISAIELLDIGPFEGYIGV
jgi:hypothetical protein